MTCKLWLDLLQLLTRREPNIATYMFIESVTSQLDQCHQLRNIRVAAHIMYRNRELQIYKLTQ